MGENQELKDSSRRNFLASSGKIAAAGVAATGLVGTAFGDSRPGVCSPMPEKWDESYDVVIIGSGFTGLAAAWEALKAGASVVVIDKMRTAGGNSIINGGGLAAPGSPLQEKFGIKDSPDLMYQDMIREGQGLNHPELARIVAEESWPAVKWLMDEFGIPFADHLMQEGGHSVPRSYLSLQEVGSDVVNPMLDKLRTMGLEVRTQVYVENIVRDEADGRVKGLKVRTGYRFPNAASGAVKYIKARKGVILAHGGFSQDVAFRMIQDPKLTATMQCTNQPGSTSEMLRESLRVGATPVQLSWIQVGPWGSPDEKGFGLGPHFAQEAACMFGIWINTSTGKRFINELANRKVRADAIMNIMNHGQKCIAIADSRMEGNVKTLLPKLLERGIIKQFNTWDEVAAAYDVPVDVLKKTVADYNRYLAQGKDDEFGRYLNKDAKPLGTAPIYVQRLLPKVHYTMGGVNINVEAQVTDIMTDNPIPGLYAGGESTGGVHGAVRLGTVSSATCLVFGRRAGRNAANQKPWSTV